MNKTKISAEIVADSLDSRGNRLTSLLITFPRIILAEINTHRMLSKNTSSSRAIPFKKMVESVQNDPFIPIAWQKEHKGMQGSEYKTGDSEIKLSELKWLEARDNAVNSATLLTNSDCVTKQLCNRLLEPFMWTTMLITGSKEGWDNFFSLRCPDYVFHDENKEYHFESKKDVIQKFGESEWVEDEYDKPLKDLTDIDWLQINKGQAEIHMMMLAEKIYDAMNESTPKQLQAGEWHIPFEDKINVNDVKEIIINNLKLQGEDYGELEISKWYNEVQHEKVKISVAMAARTSYTIVGEEKGLDYEAMIGLHDRLLAQDPPHSSPLEHCARAMSDEEYKVFIKGKNIGTIAPYLYLFDDTSKGWCNNFKGFIPYRYLIDNQMM